MKEKPFVLSHVCFQTKVHLDAKRYLKAPRVHTDSFHLATGKYFPRALFWN